MSKPVNQPLIYQTQREFDRVMADLKPRLDAMVEQEPAYGDPEVRNVQVAQNVLRTCMEATLQRMMPYSHRTAVDLAVRVASYALSTVPEGDQEYVMAQFMQVFPDAHQMRMARGVRIDTRWRMEDGRDLPNFPDGTETPQPGV